MQDFPRCSMPAQVVISFASPGDITPGGKRLNLPTVYFVSLPAATGVSGTCGTFRLPPLPGVIPRPFPPVAFAALRSAFFDMADLLNVMSSQSRKPDGITSGVSSPAGSPCALNTFAMASCHALNARGAHAGATYSVLSDSLHAISLPLAFSFIAERFKSPCFAVTVVSFAIALIALSNASTAYSAVSSIRVITGMSVTMVFICLLIASPMFTRYRRIGSVIYRSAHAVVGSQTPVRLNEESKGKHNFASIVGVSLGTYGDPWLTMVHLNRAPLSLHPYLVRMACLSMHGLWPCTVRLPLASIGSSLVSVPSGYPVLRRVA